MVRHFRATTKQARGGGGVDVKGPVPAALPWWKNYVAPAFLGIPNAKHWIQNVT